MRTGPVTDCDFLIVGAGMAGASAGYELAAHGRVVVLERESQPGYHTTGRSAAFFVETYGNATIRKLTIGSKSFFTDPPDGFCDHPLLSPQSAIHIGRDNQCDALRRTYDHCRTMVGDIAWLDGTDVVARVSTVRPDYVAAGVLEPGAQALNVHAIHQGFLKGLRGRGGAIVTDAEVQGATYFDGTWQVETPAGRFAAPVLINAAGAWADKLAERIGADPVGLVPKRRTVITFDPPAGLDTSGWPLVVDAEEQFYFKPDSGRILASPADETPMEPCDVQPDELDVAIAVDRLQNATDLEIKTINRKWAGLRSFVADKSPVVGFDPKLAGFFWLAGQGGYGIQTAPAMGRTASALARCQAIPTDLAALGLRAEELAPDRPDLT